MDEERAWQLKSVYRKGLLDDTLPFWIEHAVDREHGGFLFCLDRGGTVIDPDKGMWHHGRFVWLLSTLCETVERQGGVVGPGASRNRVSPRARLRQGRANVLYRDA